MDAQTTATNEAWFLAVFLQRSCPSVESTAVSSIVRNGSKAEKLQLSKCLLPFPQQRTFIKATTADSTLIDAARENPELIDKFADSLIALSSGGLSVLNSKFLRMNHSHRSGADDLQRIDHPPPQAR
jgi:hypothetical protein